MKQKNLKKMPLLFEDKGVLKSSVRIEVKGDVGDRRLIVRFSDFPARDFKLKDKEEISVYELSHALKKHLMVEYGFKSDVHLLKNYTDKYPVNGADKSTMLGKGVFQLHIVPENHPRKPKTVFGKKKDKQGQVLYLASFNNAVNKPSAIDKMQQTGAKTLDPFILELSFKKPCESYVVSAKGLVNFTTMLDEECDGMKLREAIRLAIKQNGGEQHGPSEIFFVNKDDISRMPAQKMTLCDKFDPQGNLRVIVVPKKAPQKPKV